MGANQDAILEAGNLGINAGQAINYSESREETEAVYRSAAAMVGGIVVEEMLNFYKRNEWHHRIILVHLLLRVQQVYLMILDLHQLFVRIQNVGLIHHFK